MMDCCVTMGHQSADVFGDFDGGLWLTAASRADRDFTTLQITYSYIITFTVTPLSLASKWMVWQQIFEIPANRTYLWIVRKDVRQPDHRNAFSGLPHRMMTHLSTTIPHVSEVPISNSSDTQMQGRIKLTQHYRNVTTFRSKDRK